VKLDSPNEGGGGIFLTLECSQVAVTAKKILGTKSKISFSEEEVGFGRIRCTKHKQESAGVVADCNQKRSAKRSKGFGKTITTKKGG